MSKISAFSFTRGLLKSYGRYSRLLLDFICELSIIPPWDRKYFIAYMTFLSLCYQIQFRGRPEISADQREKYLQRYHQVQQQQGNLLNVSNIAGINQKQFPTQQPNPLLQQVLPSVTTILKFDALCQAV